jgi:hypothetical protein
MIAAGPGGINGAAEAVGESPDAIHKLLGAAGYDLGQLSSGDAAERMSYAVKATEDLFPDIRAKYRADTT